VKKRLRPGSLIRFTSSVYISAGWGLGLVIGSHDIYDRDGANHTGFHTVLTAVGVKAVHEVFMLAIEEVT
jgi:hypothetical protein